MNLFVILAALLAFMAVAFTVFAVNLVLVDMFRKDQDERRDADFTATRLEERRLAKEKIKAQQLAIAQSTAYTPQVGDEQKLGFMDRWKLLCQQSGVNITPQKHATYCAISGLVTGAIVGAASFSLLIGVVAAMVGATFPLLYLIRARENRRNLLRSQLPDAFELMSRVMRSGQTISQAMNCVSDEFMPPVATEFGYCHEQQNLGLNPDLALRELASRTGVMEIKIFVLALAVHRQAGGNLTELLDKLAGVVRQRARLVGDVKGLTSEGRMQAIVLMGLPVLVWVALFFLNRDYAVKLFDHPSLILGTIAAMIFGALWINRIVNFDF